MKLCLTSLLALVLLSAHAPPSVCAQSDVNPAQIAQTLVRAHIGWRTRLSSPNASMQAKEKGREGSVVRYNLYVSGLPTDKLYSVLSWPIVQTKPSTVMQGLSIGKGGLVICAGRTPEQCVDPSEKDGPVDFTFNPAKGEPYRLALYSGDYRAAIVIVPDPIIGEDKGCSISVERLLPHFELAYLSGTGFSPDSDLKFAGESYGEKHAILAKADSQGNFSAALLPAVAGHQKGTTTLKGVGMSCSPSLKFDWGQ